ncbi:CapA family protein [Clostridium sp. HBUAS56010]|uniref:CapA family protein n=1 Tax=Clostridium sp. HBUAS56010 TaxID=2571127 RepID=UPI0011778597|nr:CapA family protein [Clostridium sp. HBUAS56010]
MKKTNRGMKILVLFPILLFLLLLVWIGMSEWKGRGGSADFANGAETTGAAESENSEPLTLAQSETETEQGLETETEPQNPLVRLLFAGDILLSNHVTTAYDKAKGIHGVLDEGFRSEIGQSDIFMANEEFPFSERGSAAPDKQFTFRLSPSRVSMMNEIGVDIVALANNHSLDYGTDALVDTCNVLEGAGIRYVGAGPDMNRAKQLETMEVNGKTIGFLAASRVYPDPDWVANSRKPGMVSGYDPTILLEEIKKAESICDYVVVYIHWGIERDDKPQEYQRGLGKQMIDAGADIVIGSHPHVLQGIEYYNGKPICYSLGNFIFGSSIPKTALLRVDVGTEKNTAALSLVPGTSKAGYTRTLGEEQEKLKFYQYIQDISFGVTVDENGVIHNNP